MKADYAEEKLYVAVTILAEGNSPLRDRLRDAYVSALMRVRPDEDIPWPDLREKFIFLMEEIAPNGDVGTALNGWGETDLKRLATTTVGLFWSIVRDTEADRAID